MSHQKYPLFKQVGAALAALTLVLSFHLVHAGSEGTASTHHIDPEKILFGIEYTFQDEEMVNEPGRCTCITDHKQMKRGEVLYHYIEELGLSASPKVAMEYSERFLKIIAPSDGEHTLVCEPVCIEITTTPKHVSEIEAAASKVFAAAKRANLVPYLRPAAERSGMGHIHVGGATLGESPFFQNPTLLRNMMVYLHKHPSVLYGFSEAYDLGYGSNIETYHTEVAINDKRQKAFQLAVQDFDQWYLPRLDSGESVADGLETFLRRLSDHDCCCIGFYMRFRYMNLANLSSFYSHKNVQSLSGKKTVEFRNFRPPKSPLHAKATAELLISLMDHLAQPGYLEKFEWISAEQYSLFLTGSKIAADWEIVRKELGIENPLLDEMIQEYVGAVHSQSYPCPSIPDAQVFAAYSPKEKKGRCFEIRIPVDPNEDSPVKAISIEDSLITLEKVQIGNQFYWIGYLNSDQYSINPNLFEEGEVPLSLIYPEELPH